MALAADFKDGFNGVVRWTNESARKGNQQDKVMTTWPKVERFKMGSYHVTRPQTSPVF
jgi:hypothetical protein